MIIAKIIIFFLASFSTINMIEEVMQRHLLNSKDSSETLHYDFTHGHAETFGFRNTAFTILLWTAFYALHQF